MDRFLLCKYYLQLISIHKEGNKLIIIIVILLLSSSLPHIARINDNEKVMDATLFWEREKKQRLFSSSLVQELDFIILFIVTIFMVINNDYNIVIRTKFIIVLLLHTTVILSISICIPFFL